MPDFGNGLERAFSALVSSIIVGVLTGRLIPALVESGLLPKGLFSGIVVLSIISVVMTIDASRYWPFGYLAGFAVGIFLGLPIFAQTDLIGLTDLILYGGAAVGAIALRVKIHS